MGDRPERLYAKPLRANELVERPEVDDGPPHTRFFLGREGSFLGVGKKVEVKPTSWADGGTR